jgi:exodeoxyribonuclease-3
MIKLVSWNVNGIRACHKGGFLKFLKSFKPDAICMQEVKAEEKSLPGEMTGVKGYELYWNSAKRKGYAGTGAYINEKLKKRLKNVRYGIGKKKFDAEGRAITFEFDKFYLVNVYFPNAQRGLTRLKFKLEFDKEFHKYLNKLRKKKPVVVCGDFNVAHREIDLANPKQNEKNAGFTREERAWMDKFIEDKYTDTFRMFEKKGGKYTWWTYRFNARKRNIGWRVDYFVVSDKLRKKVKKSYILSKVYGSDHAPIALEIKI